MSSLLTDNPIALRALMSETLFSAGFPVEQTVPSSGFQEAEAKTIATETTPLPTPSASTSITESSSVSVDVPKEFIYQGSADKGILFILRYPDFDYFSPGALDAFEKILAAVKLGVSDVAVVNLANTHNPNDFKRIMQFFKPTRVTLLGVEPASLLLPHIAHNSYMKGKVATVFNTFSFEEMFADLEKKKAFWSEFKNFVKYE